MNKQERRGEPSGSPLARANDATPIEAALLYAVELKWPVFPANGAKEPLMTKRGLYDASTDERRIRAWWRERPDANVAVPTGAVSGIVVIDADGEVGKANAEGLLGEDALTALQVVTGRGGRHYYFEHPGEGRRVYNSAGKIAPGIDVRGDGGYVVLPPSRTTGAYRWQNPEGALPPWRWASTDAQEDVGQAVPLRIVPPVEAEDPGAVATRDELTETVRAAPEGTRNNTLFQAAAHIGFLVGAGALDAERSAAVLIAAGGASGLDSSEVTKTVRATLQRGAAKTPKTDDTETPDIARTLDDVAAFLKQFVRFANEAQPIAVTLWVAHTHAIGAAACTPYLWVSSPAPTSGKTRLAEVVELLVHSPLRAADASPSSIFRAIPLWHPTVLLDELDTKFRGTKSDDGAEDLRRLVNSGFNRGAYVLRTEGKDRIPTKFDTFCAKMLIGINTGAFPDTVAKRSIPIRLQRKLRSEKVERFRLQAAEAAAGKLNKALAVWAKAHAKELTAARPLPDALNDRQQDAWEPLLAIADMAGRQWAKNARDAARTLHGALEDETTEAVLLLQHIREAFDESGADRLLTGVLLTALIQNEEGPWAIWWERAISNDNLKGPGSKLARMLSPYGIKPTTVRTGKDRAKGYKREQFVKVWDRYFDTPPSTRDKRDTAGSVTRDVTTVTFSEGGTEDGGDP